jgi:hypothetical protein
MGEAIPDYVGVYKMHGGGVSYTARAIRCGDRLVVVVAPEFIRNWGLEEGQWVTVHLNYVGPLDEKEWAKWMEMLHGRRGDAGRI